MATIACSIPHNGTIPAEINFAASSSGIDSGIEAITAALHPLALTDSIIALIAH